MSAPLAGLGEASPLGRTDAAIARGVAFLRESRDQGACWRSFDLPVGLSDAWVTAFVTAWLQRLPAASSLVIDGSRRLNRLQRADGGWAYNRNVSPDADSTAWSLLALISAARSPGPIRVAKGLNFLRRHQTDKGGFSTYARGEGARLDGGFRQDWETEQPCVTAAAMLALLAWGVAEDRPEVQRAADYLLGCRNPDGLWTSCWWSGFAYPTSMVLAALSAARRLCTGDRERAEHAIAARRLSDGGWSADGEPPADPFATALALIASFTVGAMPGGSSAWREDAGLLRSCQREDGSWQAPPFLRVPDVEPGRTAVFEDTDRSFTSAVVLKALHRARRVPW